MAKQQVKLFSEVETDMPFPLEGLDETRAYMRQRKMTTASAQNCRSFDPATDRARGGQRHGLVKFFPGLATGPYPIQDINHLVFSSANSVSGQVLKSLVSPMAGPALLAGQFTYALTPGNAFGVGSGVNGASIFTGTANAGYRFACSCWDTNGKLYVIEVNQATGATILSSWQANGVKLWSVAGPTVATGANRNVCGMAVNATTGHLFIAVTAAAAPLYRLWVYSVTDGSIVNWNSHAVPLVANDATAAFGGFAASAVNTSLAFSTASVNCMALLNPSAATSTLGIDSTGGATGTFIVVFLTATQTQQTNFIYTGMTKSTSVRSKAVSDGSANWYVLRSTTNHRLARITSAGAIAWGNALTTWDAITPQDIAFDSTGPTSNLVIVGSISGALRSANAVNLTNGAALFSFNAGGISPWNGVDADGKGNFVLWRDSQASTDVMGVGNNFATIWGPTTFANAVHSGASVNRVPVSTSANVITVTNPGSQVGPVNVAASLQITASDSAGGQTLTYVATGLPTGLSIAATTGLITGTPTATGSYSVVVTVSDTTGASGTASFTWTINAGSGNTVTVTSPGGLAGNAGTLITALQITGTDSDPNQTLTFSATGLPPGLAISGTGVITGVPSTGGTYSVTVTARDTTGSAGSTTFGWIVSGSGSGSGSGRSVLGLVVSNGELRIFDRQGTRSVSGGSGAMNANASVIWSAPCLGNMFYVDGASYVYYNSSTNAVTTWAATAGTLPVDRLSLPARLIALWRGRLVLSGLPNDPANWFMAAQLSPFDFNYSPATTTTTQAVAGNNSPAGQIGDVITCLIPYTDDTMVFGCTHSIWQMTGDPMQGGQLTVVSHSLGMAWGRPFAIDPMNQVYFMGSDRGIYKMVPGALPVRISQAINKRLMNVDLSQNLVTMVWDMVNQGLGVFITPFQAGATTHFFWEQRTNSWWPQVFANTNHDPLAVHVFDSDRPEDEVVMFGGRDGYVRNWSENAPSDDGTPIASFVVLGPLSTRDLDEILLKELQATLGTGSGNVTFQVYVGNTAEAALASTAVASGTWKAGRNHVEYIRRAGIEIYLKLSAVTPWALERITARFAPQGRIRRRSP